MKLAASNTVSAPSILAPGAPWARRSEARSRGGVLGTLAVTDDTQWFARFTRYAQRFGRGEGAQAAHRVPRQVTRRRRCRADRELWRALNQPGRKEKSVVEGSTPCAPPIMSGSRRHSSSPCGALAFGPPSPLLAAYSHAWAPTRVHWPTAVPRTAAQGACWQQARVIVSRGGGLPPRQWLMSCDRTPCFFRGPCLLMYCPVWSCLTLYGGEDLGLCMKLDACRAGGCTEAGCTEASQRLTSQSKLRLRRRRRRRIHCRRRGPG